jgi:hypothetical protein
MGFFISLFVFIVVDALISGVLITFGIDPRIIDVVVSLVIAFIFAYINSPKPVWNKLAFHKNFSFIFIILLFLRFIFRYARF